MGLAASQARMMMLTARKGDLNLEADFLTKVRTSLTNHRSAIFETAINLPSNLFAQSFVETRTRLDQLEIANEILVRRFNDIYEANEAVENELEEIKDKIEARIATSFQAMDRSSQAITHRIRRGHHRSANPPNNPLPVDPPTNAAPTPPIENPVDLPETTQSHQLSRKLPLWRCICWHIWLCVICTTVGSCVFGIVWSVIFKNVADAFTVASYLLAMGTLIAGVLMLKHNEACVQRSQRRRGEDRTESVLLLTLNTQPG